MNNDIAIIGMAGKFPMADDLGQLFENLKNGRDCVTDISAQRLASTALSRNRKYKRCGFLNDVDKFDYPFFGVSLAEAKTMCPEQRLLLEVVYSTIEDSGYAPSALSNSNTGVFVSTAQSNYYQFASEYVSTLYTGNSPEFLAAKVGRHFNLKGNVSVVDTTCSSSLVALHSACHELNAGDAEMCIVAGVNLILFPFYGASGLDTESPDGKSRAFSAQANGMSFGEVAAAILLKPLAHALRDNDQVHAIIKGTAVNYNGNNSFSITAPDSNSQAEVLLKAWKKAGVKATDLSYIEAHGSGTQLGDSLEFEALNRAFNTFTDKRQLCPISTIKSNVGHGRNVSGLSGMLKTVLSLKNKVLFPTIHFETPNPLLDFKNSCVYVNTELEQWRVAEGKTRFAGVTTLGASGTNCHIVLQEAPERKIISEDCSDHKPFIVPLSARSRNSLNAAIKALSKFLENDCKASMEDISYTLTYGRDHHEFRKSYLVSNHRELNEMLKAENAEVASTDNKIIVVLADSCGLKDEYILQHRRRYPLFDTFWKNCRTEDGLDTGPTKDFAFQYSLYSTLNFEDASLLPTGIGLILHRVITKELTLGEGLKMARSYHRQEIDGKEERMARLIAGLKGEQGVSFFDLSYQGALSEEFSVYRLEPDFAYIGAGQTKFDSMMEMTNILYLRHHTQQPAFYFNRLELKGNRISLPGYQFDKLPAWLADKPLADSETGTITGKLRLKEKASYLERKVAEVFCDVLDNYDLSLKDDFFELGGDSLKCTKVIHRIRLWCPVELDFEDLFDFPQIHALAGYLGAKMDTLSKVRLIWEEILELPGLKHNADFFELGGHSLLATQIIMQTNQEFNIQLNFEDIFRHTTIEKLAGFIDSVQMLNDNNILANVIVPAPAKTSYPLTHAQKRMFFLDQFIGKSNAYNNVLSMKLEGELNVEIFNQAFNKVIAIQESLRTVFKIVDGEARQIILDESQAYYNVEVVDLNKGSMEQDLVQLSSDEAAHLFDISQFPLLRCRLLRTGNKEYICILNIHHIISDGTSIGILLDSFYDCYEQLSLGQPIKLDPLPVQMKDYAEWQYAEQFAAIRSIQEAYWLNRFDIPPAALMLPYDQDRPPVQSFLGQTISAHLTYQQMIGLKALARNNGATLYMVLLAIYNVLLHKLSDAEDIAVGTTVAGRRFKEIQPLIGLCANTLVIRNHLHGSMTFTDLIAAVKTSTIEAFNHQEYPYDELVQKVVKYREPGRNPLFDTMFILQNTAVVKGQFGNIVTSSFTIPNESAQFDLLLEAQESANGIEMHFNYATELFNKETVERIIQYFQIITDTVLQRKDVTIGEIDILSAAQKDQLINHFNNTALPFKESCPVNTVFEEIAELQGSGVAIVVGDQIWTYAELNESSNRLAHHLLTLGVRPEDRIGIMINRSFEMVACIFAVWKAGCAYVPLDPGYPVDRIAYIISDSSVRFILTSSDVPQPEGFGSIYVDVKPILNDQQGIISNTDVLSADSRHLAYIIYTSGSTGRPKGVMIEHRSLLNFAAGIFQKIDFDSRQAMLALTTISFDIFLLEVILPLLKGKKVIIGNSIDKMDPHVLTDIVTSGKIDMVQLTPSHLKMWLAASPQFLDNIQVLMVGGEALPDDLYRAVKNRYSGEFYNMYGPTETTVWSTVKSLHASDSANIGQPIANTSVFILGNSGQLQPVGLAGELCIGGAGLARGYWNNKALTQERFSHNPANGNQLIYHTGDIARWLPNGEIQYIGRRDSQVKIRGYRIELGEIEVQLTSFPEVREAVVVSRGPAGDQNLVAYYTSSAEINNHQLRDHLLLTLPAYMIPIFFQQLTLIPLTPNGKIDRNQLPQAEISHASAYIKPQGKTEEALTLIWSELLQIRPEEISVYDSFFELGGHSFTAIRLIAALQFSFSVTLTMREIFEKPSISNMAGLIGQKETHYSTLTGSQYKPHQSFYPLSSAQQRLYSDQFLNNDSLSYHITKVYQMADDLNIQKISNIFQQLVDRHESLRTGFEMGKQGLGQIIHHDIKFDLEVVDDPEWNEAEALNDFVRPFDLSACPLLRARICSSRQGSSYLLVDIHHICCDGMSLSLLMEEFLILYNNGSLPKKNPLRYVDYVSWLSESVNQDRPQAYWSKKLAGDIPALNLPVLDFTGDRTNRRAFLKSNVIEGKLYRQIKTLINQSQTSDYIYFLSAYFIFLSKLSGNEDLVVGTDVVGRTDPSLMGIIGTFTNLLPIRVTLDPADTFAQILLKVKNEVLDAFDYQEYAYNQIVSDYIGQSVNAHELVSTHFAFPNFLETGKEDSQVFKPYELEKEPTTTFQLQAEVFDKRKSYHLRLTFIKALFDDDLADIFVLYYLNVIANVTSNPALAIRDINADVLIK